MFAWDCTDGETVHYAHDYAGVVCPPQIPQPVWRMTSSTRHPVNYGKLNMEKDSASEHATRSIFWWLRFDGCAPDEKEMWKHEWLEVRGRRSRGGGRYGSCIQRPTEFIFHYASLLDQESMRVSTAPAFMMPSGQICLMVNLKGQTQARELASAGCARGFVL